MAKSYSGLDKTEAFFAHYGRKGMKRGMNIYNPNYKPIGEKAQGVIRSKSKAMNIGDKFASEEERAAFKETVKENKEMAEKAKKFNRYKEKAAKELEQFKGEYTNEHDLKTAVKAYNEAYSIINKALGIKTSTSEGEEALVENLAHFKQYIKENKLSGAEEAYEDAMKKSSMEDATKVRSLAAKENEQSKIKRVSKNREKDRREALMEAERKRQANIYRR